jgi:hypothetical protein
VDFAEWLALGQEKGWASPQYCGSHDTGLTNDELAVDDADLFDMCIPTVRLFPPEKAS